MRLLLLLVLLQLHFGVFKVEVEVARPPVSDDLVVMPRSTLK